MTVEIQQNLCANATRKIALLITKASNLGMDISGYGQAGENGNSGNVYLWLEDYPFTLFIDLSGDDEIQAIWTNSYNGDEETRSANDATLRELQAWAGYMEVKAESMEGLHHA